MDILGAVSPTAENCGFSITISIIFCYIGFIKKINNITEEFHNFTEDDSFIHEYSYF